MKCRPHLTDHTNSCTPCCVALHQQGVICNTFTHFKPFHYPAYTGNITTTYKIIVLTMSPSCGNAKNDTVIDSKACHQCNIWRNIKWDSNYCKADVDNILFSVGHYEYESCIERIWNGEVSGVFCQWTFHCIFFLPLLCERNQEMWICHFTQSCNVVKIHRRVWKSFSQLVFYVISVVSFFLLVLSFLYSLFHLTAALREGGITPCIHVSVECKAFTCQLAASLWMKNFKRFSLIMLCPLVLKATCNEYFLEISGRWMQAMLLFKLRVWNMRSHYK